jgi:hypothetical protein
LTSDEFERDWPQFVQALRKAYGVRPAGAAVTAHSDELAQLLCDSGFDADMAAIDAAMIVDAARIEAGPERWRLYVADVLDWFAAPRSQADAARGWFSEVEGGGLLPKWSRARIWDALGLSGPIRPGRVGRWLHAQAAKQERAGDRLTLHLPVSEILPAPRSRGLAATGDELQEAVREYADGDFAAYRSGRRPDVHVYAGRYGDRDICDPEQDDHFEYFRGVLPSLFQLALAIRQLQQETHCAPEDALMFLLADVRFTPPYASIRTSLARGISLWCADSMVPVSDVAALLRSVQRRMSDRPVPRRQRQRTEEMVAFVASARRENHRASWAELRASWNREHPEWAYRNGNAMRSAYSQARKRDRLAGRCGPTGTEGGAE